MTDARTLAVIRTYRELLAVCRSQVGALGLNYAIVDVISGFTDTYATKLLADNPQRHFSAESFDAFMRTLGIELVAREVPEWCERTRQLAAQKLLKREGPIVMRSIARKPDPKWLFTPKKARAAGLKRWKDIPRDQRTRMARRSARKGWAKVKAAQRAAKRAAKAATVTASPQEAG